MEERERTEKEQAAIDEEATKPQWIHQDCNAGVPLDAPSGSEESEEL